MYLRNSNNHQLNAANVNIVADAGCVVCVCVSLNNFVLHKFGKVPAPSSWLTVTASPTNCSLINYASLSTIKPFEFPKFS